MGKVTLNLDINANACISLPAVDRIHGIALYKEATPKDSYIGLQYDNRHTEKPLELRIPLLDALYLLNLLEKMSGDNGLDPLRRPPPSTPESGTRH